MIGFEDARRTVLDGVRPVSRETVPLAEADGRVLGADLAAPCDMPRWDNSAMDGFAVRAAELAAGGARGLPVTGFLPAGQAVDSMPIGAAYRIMTGAPLPPGADAVLPFEDAIELAGGVAAKRAIAPGDNIRRRGGDIHQGELLLSAGDALGPAEIALLASFSQVRIDVFRRPRVAILSTGDELTQPGAELTPGSIYDSNGPALAAAARRAGAIPVLLGVAPDERAALRDRLTEGLEADALVTTAGVSVGDRDLVREELRAIGVSEAFWKVAIQPGRPTAFGRYRQRLVFSLPGNPVAAMVTFDMFVRPALRALAGLRRPLGAVLGVRLGEDVVPRLDRVTLLRVRLERREAELVAFSSGRQATGYFRTLLAADAVAIVPAGRSPLPAGTLVEAYPLRDEFGLGPETS